MLGGFGRGNYSREETIRGNLDKIRRDIYSKSSKGKGYISEGLLGLKSRETDANKYLAHDKLSIFLSVPFSEGPKPRGPKTT